MEVIIWIFILISILLLTIKYLKNKYIAINHTTIIAIFFLLPLILYLLKWSNILEQKINTNFVYVISIFLIIYNVDIVTSFKIRYNFIYTIKRYNYINKLAIFYVFVYLLENFLLSGSFFPILIGKSFQHKNIPILNFLFTRNLLPIIILLYLSYLKQKNKRTIILGIILITIPIFTRGARIYVFQDILALVMLILLLSKEKLTYIKKNKLKIVLIFLFSTVLMTSITNYRLKKFGYQGDVKKIYTNAIGYDGIGGEIGAIIYAYFPMSYDNLNRSLSNDREIELNKNRVVLNYFGINTFKGLYLGFLKFNKIFNFETDSYITNSIYVIGAANVPTMFYEFYIDYGMYIFIPIILLFLISKYLEFKSRNNLINLCLYCIFSSGLFLISFQNLIFDYYLVWKILMIIIYIKIFIKEEKK